MQMVDSSYDGNYNDLYIFDCTQEFTPNDTTTQCYASRREPWKMKST